ncbi:hypothetical protein [Allorhizobium borbori]|uniref:Uncharacterized protein n=1 Tax=Allorhizobium borbori TaxID=485907 RepID=A0A7W6P1H5_9HYPH|nr:hypothetical protein [Allorhizobium borbori]MBB4103583.1 hypothetical protein [Allorhizobium borbori]
MDLHIETVTDLRWVDAAQTKLVGIVKFAEFQDAAPFSFCSTAPVEYPHEADFWDRSTSGEFGTIADYVPPSVDEMRASMPPLTARQLRLGLIANGIMPSQVQSAIEAMPSGPSRENALVEWEYASSFERMHPLIASVAAGLSLTAEQVDAMWMAAVIL